MINTATREKIDQLLKLVAEKSGSDLHIGADSPPLIRVDEKLEKSGIQPLSKETARELAYSMLTPDQVKKFEKNKELDFSFELADIGRFRVNVFYQRGSVGCSIRLIPFTIMNFEECGLPVETTKSLCKRPKGLVLVTGATGSGKSTTLAAMVDYINNERPCHIVTIEDPIEFVHKNKMALIDQREVYEDTHSFSEALKHVLRQDPDVILIGEMRDLETIETALICAETGHLVFATLHTSDSVQTINRVIDVFPAYQQQQIRTQLSFVLIGIISQQLIPKATGRGRVLATEVLISNPAVKSLIRESKAHQIYSVIQTGQKEGMFTMNQSLYDLCREGRISYDDAFGRTLDPDDLSRLLKK
ncbi:MAG: type IV pilus twitching motility protein PilT [Candidatus Omnitrophica bacterium]|nr:type IV pilus twitching motility protein PilT [Candidatus Omnitrophota bacterium]